MARDTNNPDFDRRDLLKIAGTGVAVSLAGCAGGDSDASGGTDNTSDATSGSERGGTLYFAQVKGALDLDPIVANDVPSAQINGLIYDGLYEWDADLNIVPKLAADDPEVERDGVRYIIPLREDAQFHNGDPVTAEDVIHTVEAPVEEETENAPELSMVDASEAIDEYTVQFDLAYPYGAFPTALVRSVVNANVRTEDREAYNREPVSSGPFELVEFEVEDYAELARYDDYWGETVPNLEEIQLDPIEEPTTRITNLETGDSDIIETIPPQSYSVVENMNSAAITEEPGIGYFYLAFNCAEGPTSDPVVREAVDYSFSMDQAVENFIEPAGVRQVSPFPRAMAESWDFPLDEWGDIEHDQDIEMAQQLFDEAGVDYSYNWNIIVPPDSKREQIGIAIGDGLQAVGFDNVSVQRYDWGEFLDLYVSGNEDDYNMYTLGWSGSPDPDAFAYQLLTKVDEVEGVNNGTFHPYQEASDKIVQARESADREERRQLYIDGVTTLLEERVHIPAYNLNNSYGIRDRVQGYTAHPISSELPVLMGDTNVSVQ